MPPGGQGLLVMDGFCDRVTGILCMSAAAAAAGAGPAGAATDVGPAAAGAGAGPQTEREAPVLSLAVVITWPAGQLVAGGAAFAIALLPPSRQLAGNLFDSSACPAPA